jgi:hypothetical protein
VFCANKQSHLLATFRTGYRAPWRILPTPEPDADLSWWLTFAETQTSESIEPLARRPVYLLPSESPVCTELLLTTNLLGGQEARRIGDLG